MYGCRHTKLFSKLTVKEVLESLENKQFLCYECGQLITTEVLLDELKENKEK